MAAKGRGRKNHPTGEAAYRAKLTREQAQQIRRLRAEGVNQRAVAKQFGVHRCTVQEITSGRAYK
jgi:DNA invertase Pin-like site-specific DNA recombinase